MSMDETMSFEVEREKNVKTKEILTKVYQALEEKGYNPINHQSVVLESFLDSVVHRDLPVW